MFTLIDLHYPTTSLEPIISGLTLSFHHGRHLQSYVDNLNKLIPGTEYEDLCNSERNEESILKELLHIISEGPIFNNAGQILNHNMYFRQFKNPEQLLCMSKMSENRPGGKLLNQIKKQWGSLDIFKSEFEAKGVSLFGSGWVWLSAQSDGTLVITQEPGAGNPVTKDLKPLLTFDVWEHAYYLDYQNRRATHLSALWQILDWSVIEARYNQA